MIHRLSVTIRAHRPDADLARQIDALFVEIRLDPDDMLAGVAAAIAVRVEERPLASRVASET